MAPELTALILAAGFSSRMGGFKPLLPLGERNVLAHCIDLFRVPAIKEVVVVTGHRAEEVGAAARAAGARVVHNPEHAAGMYSSIRAGVRQLGGQCGGFFLMPVDIPLVRRGTIRLLNRSLAQTPARILYPVFAGRRGHPPLLGAALIPAICDGEAPPGGLRTLLARIESETPDQVREVQVADSNIHIDLDTPEDFLAGSLRLSRRDFPSLEECAAILAHLHPVPVKGLAHGRKVAEVAELLCQAVNRGSGSELDPELCMVGGLLHDLAEGHPHHEAEGALWLYRLGFDRAAAIVAAHKDLDWSPAMAISEREIVHLADKLVRGRRLISLEERFAEKLRLYRDDPEARQAISGRLRQAYKLAVAIEAAAGQSLGLLIEPLAAAEAEYRI